MAPKATASALKGGKSLTKAPSAAKVHVRSPSLIPSDDESTHSADVDWIESAHVLSAATTVASTTTASIVAAARSKAAAAAAATTTTVTTATTSVAHRGTPNKSSFGRSSSPPAAAAHPHQQHPDGQQQHHHHNHGHHEEQLKKQVDFYKSQVDVLNGRVETLLDDIRSLPPPESDIASLRTQLTDKSSEVTRLTNYASKLNTSILSEKGRSLELQGEVERLRIVELELRKELEQARASTKTTQATVTFYRDCRPERMLTRPPPENGKGFDSGKAAQQHHDLSTPARFLDGRLGAPTSTEESDNFYNNNNNNMPPPPPSTPPRKSASKSPSHVPSSASFGRTNPPPLSATTSSPSSPPVYRAHSSHVGSSPSSSSHNTRQLLRTVYLPNERSDALVLMVESLSSQLLAHKRLSAESFETQAQDFGTRERQYASRLSSDESLIKGLTSQLNDKEAKLRESLASLHTALHELGLAERRTAEREMDLTRDLDTKTRERQEFSQEISVLKREAKSHSAVHHKNLLLQVSESEKDVHSLREHVKDIQKAYEAKIAALNIKLESSKEKFKSLEERRHVEIGTFQKDTNFLKSNIVKLESELNAKKTAEQLVRNRTSSTAEGLLPSGGAPLSGRRSSSNMGESSSASRTAVTAETVAAASSLIKRTAARRASGAEVEDPHADGRKDANENFYGGSGVGGKGIGVGVLNEDMMDLIGRVQSLAKEVEEDGVAEGMPRHKTVVVLESTSQRRGSYFGAVKNPDEVNPLKNISVARDAITEAWLSTARAGENNF